jgi:hypothetical protein
VVLSYKNHAIDEFLVDLVKTIGPSTLRNSLIRIGGQCKDPRLAAYSERVAYQNDVDVKNRRKVFDRLDILKRSIACTMEGKVSSFLSFRHAIFDVKDDARTVTPTQKHAARQPSTQHQYY